MDYTQSFLKTAKSYPEFEQALDIIRPNFSGRAWLIGGFVFRNIIQDLYGIPVSKEADFDFIIEEPKDIVLPRDWRIERNSYGNPKLIGPSFEIDYVPINNVHSIIRRGLVPSISNFLTGTPLNIQSIVYDVNENKIIGEIGKSSIRDREIAVNDLEQAKYRAEKKVLTLDQLVTSVANEFRFEAVTTSIDQY